jgi:hypothetical protein
MVLCGCTSKETRFTFEHSGIISVHPVENPPFMGIPLSLKYFDGRLYMSDFHGDTLVTEFDVESSQIISKSITKGGGPGESLSPLLLFLSGDTLFLFNLQAHILGYDILGASGEHRGLTSHLLCPLPSAVYNLTSIGGGQYLVAGTFNDGRYAIFNSQGEKEQEFGDYPSFLSGEKDFPASAKAMFHQVKFAVNHNLRRVACASAHVLDIVDFSSSAHVVKRIRLDYYHYEFTTGEILSTRSTDGTSVGAKSVTSTDDYIYLLVHPSGQFGSDIETEIWRFDWNGEPVKKFSVDRTITLLEAVNDSLFYAMSYPDYELVKLTVED